MEYLVVGFKGVGVGNDPLGMQILRDEKVLVAKSHLVLR